MRMKLRSLSVLWKLRAFYLVTGLAGGLLNPYMSTIFLHGGLASDRIGIVMSCSSFLIIAAQLVWGRLADRYQATKAILALSIAVPAAMSLLYQTPQISVLIVSYLIAIAFTAPQAPIGDAYAVTAARAAGSSYGAVRSFQSIGNAAGGYLAGWFVSKYAPGLLGYPFLIFGSLGIAAVLSFPRRTEVAYAGRSFLSGIGGLLKERKFLWFLGACLLINQTLTAFNTYFVVMFQMSGGSYALSGVALMIAAASNVPSMFLAAAVIRKIGLERTMLIASLAYIVRWGIQYLFPYPPAIVAVQLLQGLSFGLFYVAAVEYVVQLVPKDMQATGQSVFNVVFVGLAGIAGNLLNGFLLEAGGPAAMNLACTISAAGGALLLAAIVKGDRASPHSGLPAAS
ncbi:MFS transporter [Paenibacillus sp. TRM 82003]|nr:MFS transporter [Paenibacillus sp. TRM 82003]